jgi:homoserine kinase type II
MSVYTPVNAEELAEFLRQYPTGTLVAFNGIAGGIENTNFFVTTTGGEYVLTLFEHHSHAELGYFLTLMQYWANAGIPTPCPLRTQNGELLHSLNGKPAALVARLQGTHLEHPSPAQCAEVGAMLARMHVTGAGFPLERAPDRGHTWRVNTAHALLPLLPPEDADLLRAELDFQQTIPFGQLPTGTTHADLFRDNVLFHEGHLSGILDLYFACTDTLLYDLAVVVNDWCCQENGALDKPRLQSCLDAYQQVRPWKALEQRYWPALLRAAALRFWLSRLVAKLQPREGEMTLCKDPDAFRAILLRHIQQEQPLHA